MKSKILLNTFVLGLFFLSNSCSEKQDSLKKVFTKNELKEIDSIIDYYDNYVQSKNDKILPIEEAYTLFIENNKPTSSSEGNQDVFYISSEDRNEFLNTVDNNFLLEIYEKHDSTKLGNPKTKEWFIIYPPFHLTLNTNGKFMEFLSELARRKPYYKDFYHEIISMGDISPTIISKLLYENEDIDFSSREERFVFIISFLEFEIDLYDYYTDRKKVS